jgi:hypothetical protein
MSGDHENQVAQASVGGGGRTVTRIVIQGPSTPQGLEMLRLEIRRLAKTYGAEVTNFRIEPAEEIDLLT